MSFKNTNTKERGFTIVELLIVVVVIGILAAITIVAYNGVTNRARTASAQSAAASVQKKAELFATDGSTGKYPAAITDLTGATSDKTYSLAGSGITVQFALPTASDGTDTVRYLKCGSGSPANQAAITSSNVTGGEIYYWDFEAGNASSKLSVGITSGSGIACPTTES